MQAVKKAVIPAAGLGTRVLPATKAMPKGMLPIVDKPAIQYLVEERWQYRLISLVGTLMLMFGVIFLSNATGPLQVAFAAVYILMNSFYWIVAASIAERGIIQPMFVRSVTRPNR